MNSENIKKVTNQAIEQLVAALDQGRSETLTQYLVAIGRFHRYSLRNVMLIASQKPSATHVAGFHAWHKLGRFVKKGEKGIVILAPVVRRKNESTKQDETDESSTAVSFRAAYVFDISQTDGRELPEIGSVTGDPCEYRERLGKFIADQSITLEYSEDIAPARGNSAGGKIMLLPGQSPAEEFATLAHELAHEMMHRTERRSSTSRRTRETEAEAVAFVVCHAIGLETGSASQDYIQLYEGDAKLLTESLAHIQKAATEILNAIGAEGTSAPAARDCDAALRSVSASHGNICTCEIPASLKRPSQCNGGRRINANSTQRSDVHAVSDRMLRSFAGEVSVNLEPGDYVKFEMKDEKTGESEWMWLRIDYCDESTRLAFGWLDSEPVVFPNDLKLGQHLAVSYDNIREHRKANQF